jgi:hypothetical protein
MMIKFVIRNTDRLNKALEQKRAKIQGNLIDKINELVDLLYLKVLGKISGDVLHRRTGKLASSIQKAPASGFRGNIVGGYVTQDQRIAPYGPVHERGGRHPYTIEPVNKQILFFMTGGTKVSFMAKGQLKEFIKDRKMVFTRMVHREPAEKRSYMLASLQEMGPEIVSGIGSVVRFK